MPELLAHLIGDYILQSHVMATRKTSSWLWASIHALFYGLPFLLLASWPAWLVIVGTHAVIDRYRLAAAWCRWWGVGFPGVWWRLVSSRETPAAERRRQRALAAGDTFFLGAPSFEPPPPFLGVWLVIIVDNTAHLAINHFALAWLG